MTGRSRGGWTTKLHMVAADARTAVTFSLSPGQAHDAPVGRKPLRRLGRQRASPALVMDRAYEGDETRHLALSSKLTRYSGRASEAFRHRRNAKLTKTYADNGSTCRIRLARE